MHVADLVAQWVKPGGTLSILIFHRVLPVPDALLSDVPDVARFDRVVSLLKSRCNLLPLSEAVARLRRGGLPRRAAAITFDDGYADNHDCAVPVLARHGVRATFFVATGFMDGGIMWNDRIIESIRRTPRSSLDLTDLGLGVMPVDGALARRSAINALLPRLKYLEGEARKIAVDGVVEAAGVADALPRDLMVSSAQLAAMANAGMEIGAHTITHPILAKSDASEARREIAQSRERLMETLRQPVTLFAYPNGVPGVDYSHTHVSMVREAGFEAAVSTSSGASRPGDDLYQLPRFTPWDPPGTRFMLRLARNRLRRPTVV